MSLRTSFRTTEELLIERAQLHGLVDYFWQVLPNTRDDIYREMSTILCVDDAHISDLGSEQIAIVAEYFHNKLADIAPCSKCMHSHTTSYGLRLCKHADGHGAYWLQPQSALAERCKLYNAKGHIPSEE